MKLEQIKIIQGGMGIHISSWKLAKTVAEKGQLGVVSGTAIDTVVARILQLGDKEGLVRHALDNFPLSQMAQRVKDRFFHREGKDPKRSFKNIGLPSIQLGKAREELLIVSNFVAVFLAKEGHSGWVGINYLEKIQLPTLPSLFGAMLAGVNVVLMGAGIPSSIPGILDDLALFSPVSLKLVVDNDNSGEAVLTHFDPNDHFEVGNRPEILRPAFLAIVSSDIIAKSLEKRATGLINGYVVENYRAGGHNAPPRRDRNAPDNGLTTFGLKDEPNLDNIKAIGKPFWLAGQYSTPAMFQSALEAGATGVQVGTPFAFARESGMIPTLRTDILKKALNDELSVHTSFKASPTGYPFKLLYDADQQYGIDRLSVRKRVCDMGYLRSLYRSSDGSLVWRCPAEPQEFYQNKEGNLEDCEGRLCLCNGLAATAGVGQTRSGDEEPVLITSGEDIASLKRFISADKLDYSATEVIDAILA